MDQAHFHVDEGCGLERARSRYHLPAPQLIRVHSRQVDGQPASRQANLGGFLVRLQSAYPCFETTGHDLHLVSHTELPIGQRARHDGPEPRDAEDPVYGQAWLAFVLPGRYVGEGVCQGAFERFQAGARARRNRDDGRFCQASSRQSLT